MELVTAVLGTLLCAGVGWLTRKGYTLAQLYRVIAAELILRAIAREARAEVMRTQRKSVDTLAGVEQ